MFIHKLIRSFFIRESLNRYEVPWDAISNPSYYFSPFLLLLYSYCPEFSVGPFLGSISPLPWKGEVLARIFTSIIDDDYLLFC